VLREVTEYALLRHNSNCVSKVSNSLLIHQVCASIEFDKRRIVLNLEGRKDVKN
jgi:hypothetical protein